MSGKKKYFNNNWQEYKDAPDELFEQHTFEEVMSWKVAGWELPSSVVCIIRVTDPETRKVSEHVYRQRAAAQRKVSDLMDQADSEFVVCDHESIHLLKPPTSEDFE
jgi:hypothetical protein